MIFGIVVFPMPWSRQGKTQEFLDKFKAGPRTLNGFLSVGSDRVICKKSIHTTPTYSILIVDDVSDLSILHEPIFIRQLHNPNQSEVAPPP